MTTPPLQLEELIYEIVHVVARKGHRASGEHRQRLENHLEFGQNRDVPGLWRVGLGVKILPEKDEPEPPYDIDMQCVGFFRVHPDYPQDRAGKLVAVTGASILYSGVRDFVMTISARGPWGPFMLPTTSFIDVEPKAEDSLDTIAAAILATLREQGPQRIGDLARALDVDVNSIRSIVSEFRQQGMVETEGRGRGTKYRIPGDSGMRVAESD